MRLTLTAQSQRPWLAPADPTRHHLITKRTFHGSHRITAALFVASDLSIIEIPRAQSANFGTDLTQSDCDQRRVYRRLDLDWYQWLFHAMRKAQAKAANGEITEEAWTTMRARFVPVYGWMRMRYPVAHLQRAEANLADDRYRPPSPIRRFQAIPATIAR